MARNLQPVAPPAFTDRLFGLLSVVQARYDEPDAHWRNGVVWNDICGMAITTFAPICSGSGGPSAATPDAKDSNVDVSRFGATPFTVFAEVDCSPVGYSQAEQRARAVDALTRAEPYQVELAFATGAAGGSSGIVYPHLAATEAVTEGLVLPVSLQCATSTVSGSAVFEMTEGLGRLEALMSACFPGQFVIHVPMILAERLVSSALIKTDGAQLKTVSGNLVSLGAGYPGTSPAGASATGAAWIYATPPVFAYRSAPETFNFTEQFDRSTNTLKTIVERTYVLGFSCCCSYAVPIQITGGVPL